MTERGARVVRLWSSLVSRVRRTAVSADTPRVQQPCLVPGCDGTMTFDDSDMPAYGTWVCDRDSNHNELLPVKASVPPKTKPCSVGGCRGRMTCGFHHFRACWICNLADHEEWEWSFVWRPTRPERRPALTRREHRGRVLLRMKPWPPLLYLELPCYGCGQTFTVDTVDGRIREDWRVWRCPSCGDEGPTRSDAEAFLLSTYEHYVDARLKWAPHLTFTKTQTERLHVAAAPSKPCTATGCPGTMWFQSLQEADEGERSWRATWVCENNAAHAEFATPAEEKAVSDSGWHM